MPRTSLHFLLFSLLLVCELSNLSVAQDAPVGSQNASTPPHVITHPSVNTKSLSINQLRAIFSLRVRNWPDGSTIKVVVLEEKDPLALSFVREKLKMLPHQLRRQWDRIIYSGLGQGPLIVKTQKDMQQQVSRTNGAIGFLKGGATYEGVRILSIE